VAEDIDVDALDAADETDVLAAGCRLPGGPEQQAVVSAQPDAGCP